ncbi:RNA-directed DNA polymerase [Pseudomonas aeruginosa]|nr:RNA-directed DNA polymerase [Pseudomonas aeruginosa]
MQQKKKEKNGCKTAKSYPIDQCSLYKVGSAKRLAAVLGIELDKLKKLLLSDFNYKVFDIAGSVDPFSGKVFKTRHVQEPKDDLRAVHSRILRLLQNVSIPPYVHGAIKGRSYQTNAAAHVKGKQAATFDIHNFYGSTKSNLVHGLFHDVLACPSDVAGKLARLVTYKGMMPTGSPLSPLLSYWVAKPMFDEYACLARQYGLEFTCYIDDLTFSGDRIPRVLRYRVGVIARRYGYKISKKKTRLFVQGKVKHITGVAVSESGLMVPFSRLKAARKIMGAIEGSGESHGLSSEKLRQKLAGLIGEAATIEQRFGKWAKKARTAVS